MEGEVGVMQSQAKESQQLPVTTRSWEKDSAQEPLGECSPANLDFRLLAFRTVRGCVSVV